MSAKATAIPEPPATAGDWRFAAYAPGESQPVQWGQTPGSLRLNLQRAGAPPAPDPTRAIRTAAQKAISADEDMRKLRVARAQLAAARARRSVLLAEVEALRTSRRELLDLPTVPVDFAERLAHLDGEIASRERSSSTQEFETAVNAARTGLTAKAKVAARVAKEQLLASVVRRRAVLVEQVLAAIPPALLDELHASIGIESQIGPGAFATGGVDVIPGIVDSLLAE